MTDQTFPPLDTWTFYRSGYTSRYLTFVPVETRSTELGNPHGIRGRSILGAVNYLTAAICQLTHDQPATACTPAVRSLLPAG
jgi:hypothetical protein